LTSQIQELTLKKDAEHNQMVQQQRYYESLLSVEKSGHAESSKRCDELSSQIAIKDRELLGLDQDLSKIRSQMSEIASSTTINAKDIESKNTRISQLEQAIQELTQKNSKYTTQVDSANKAYTEMEQYYKNKIAMMEEADKLAKKQALQQKVVQPVGAKRGTFHLGSLFGGPKSGTPQKSSLGQTDREGWLHKQATTFLKTWQKRWFILKGEQLHYAKDKEASDIRGSFDITGCVISQESADRKKFVFLITSAQKKLHFMASSETDMKEWIEILQKNAGTVPSTPTRNRSQSIGYPISTPPPTPEHHASNTPQLPAHPPPSSSPVIPTSPPPNVQPQPGTPTPVKTAEEEGDDNDMGFCIVGVAYEFSDGEDWLVVDEI